MAYSDAAAMQIVLKTIASEYDLLLGRRIVNTQTTSNGVLLNTYCLAGPVKTVEDFTP